jgi:sialate O-acetylesterase
MVLQRAPAAAVIWGFSPAGSTVKTTLDSRAPALTATADAGGVWRQALPPTEAGGSHTIRVESSAGATAVLTDVLFGDVYVCGGQSNMAFSMPGITNASHEALLADNYPTIRLFTVGQGTPYQSGRQPLDNLLTVEQNWTVASSKSVAAPAAAGIQFGVFSAVCWIFGRTIHDGLGGKVPVGLVSSNWPGTRLEAWTPAPAFALCGRSAGNSNLLYNSMIHPLAVGPMALAGFTWYQVPIAAPVPPACLLLTPLLCCLHVSHCAPICLLFAHPRHHANY